MYPTNPAFCGRPHYYPPPMGPEGIAMGAAAGAAPHYAYHHHYRPRRAFGRFWWFAIGAGVATWWFHKQERKRLAASGGRDDGSNWCRTRSYRAVHDTPPPPAYPTSAAASSMQSNQQQTQPDLDSALPAAVTSAASSSVSEGAPSHDAVDNAETRRGGWWHRRHSHSGQSPPSTPASVAIEKDRAKTTPHASSTSKTETEAELERLYASAEALWEQRRREALEASRTVQVRAREHVNDGLERLIVALERIRESMAEEKRRVDDKGVEDQKKRWI